MSTLLALISCIAFTIFLLRIERRQSPDVSRAIWIPTIWMFYISSKPLANWFPASGATPESSPLDRAFLIVLLCMALWVLIRRKFNWSSAIRENPWLMILITFMFVSILWSKIPEKSFIQWIREIQAVLMASVVLSERSPRLAIESIIRRTTYVLVPFSLILIKFFPGYGRIYNRWSGDALWIGVTLQKNSLGRLCLISVLFLLWSLFRKRQEHNSPVRKLYIVTDIFLLVIALWLIKGPGRSGYSATALGALAIGLLVFVGLHISKKRGINFKAGALQGIVVLIIIFGIVTIFTGGTILGSMAPSLGRNETLTDRTQIWHSVLPIAMQTPFLGNGIGSFWTSKNIEAFTVGEAHSGYLNILLEFGFIGILLISLFFLSSCRKAYQMLFTDFDWGALWICYIIAVLVHNITESSLNTLTTQLTATILILAFSSSSSASPQTQY